MEEEEGSEMEEERDTCLNEKERKKRSADVRMQAGYAFVDEKRKRMDKYTSGDDEQAHIEEEIRELSMSASNQAKRTIREMVAFSNQLAKHRKHDFKDPNGS